MTLREKQLFVSGYLDGSSSGTSSLCDDLDSNAVMLKIKDDVAPSDRTCIHFRPEYTHRNREAVATYDYADPYVTTIDDFYKHSEGRAMPYTVILSHLNDAEYKPGEDLYKFVRSGDARWGSFTGFDGIEKCYNVDSKR